MPARIYPDEEAAGGGLSIAATTAVIPGACLLPFRRRPHMVLPGEEMTGSHAFEFRVLDYIVKR
jgi:hypothetical protein